MSDESKPAIVVLGDRVVIYEVPAGGLHIHLPNPVVTGAVNVAADGMTESLHVRSDPDSASYFDALDAVTQAVNDAIADGALSFDPVQAALDDLERAFIRLRNGFRKAVPQSTENSPPPLRGTRRPLSRGSKADA